MGGWATDTLATCKLFFNLPLTPLVTIMAIFSITIFGIGLLGIMAPIIVWPSELVYWGQLKDVVTFQALHYKEEGNPKRLKIFGWTILVSMIYEVM